MTDANPYEAATNAIEQASVAWRRERHCTQPPGCGRSDCRSHHGAWPGMCRAYAEFLAVAAVEAFKAPAKAAPVPAEP